jgi:hypothetical protein
LRGCQSQACAVEFDMRAQPSDKEIETDFDLGYHLLRDTIFERVSGNLWTQGTANGTA